MRKLIRQLLDIDSISASQREVVTSAIGGSVGILCVFYISTSFVGSENACYIIPSMGASAVLIFAVPNSPLGQPWNVFGGHILSAIIGVMCALLIPIEGLAAAASVGLAIALMHYARCMHPPGGATALAAVIGGTQIHSMGFQFVVTPVLINTVTILLLPYLFASVFKWNRYPHFSIRQTAEPSEKTPGTNTSPPIQHINPIYTPNPLDSDRIEKDPKTIYRVPNEELELELEASMEAETVTED